MFEPSPRRRVFWARAWWRFRAHAALFTARAPGGGRGSGKFFVPVITAPSARPQGRVDAAAPDQLPATWAGVRPSPQQGPEPRRALTPAPRRAGDNLTPAASCWSLRPSPLGARQRRGRASLECLCSHPTVSSTTVQRGRRRRWCHHLQLPPMKCRQQHSRHHSPSQAETSHGARVSGPVITSGEACLGFDWLWSVTTRPSASGCRYVARPPPCGRARDLRSESQLRTSVIGLGRPCCTPRCLKTELQWTLWCVRSLLRSCQSPGHCMHGPATAAGGLSCSTSANVPLNCPWPGSACFRPRAAGHVGRTSGGL